MAIVAPRFSYNGLRAVADRFLKENHSQGDIPVPIENIIEFKLKLDIVPVPGLQATHDIDAYITNDLSEIRVDQIIYQKYPSRYRFSLAHEVAHLVIHQDVFKELHFSTIAEWKKLICNIIPTDQYGWIEWQAYALGGLILVPARPLKDLFDTKLAEAAKLGIDLQDMDAQARKYVVSHIAKHFDVSADVISRRMKSDKLWQ